MSKTPQNWIVVAILACLVVIGPTLLAGAGNC